ncbi:MAG TPA: hypothetical protein PKA00_16080 [Saprospiraceae bacterium]|nr:hypothetical protein [Saprospiraceae bacterium]HMQ84434.1 hypothetical protein [Saprospiraceae bacterium]
MKRSIQLLVSTVLFLALALTVNAQRGEGFPTPEEMAERQTAHMTDQLKLSDEQKEQVKSINLTFSKKAHEIRQEQRQKEQAAMEKIKNEKLAEMKKVLSDEQYKQLEALHAERSKHPRGKGDGKRGGSGPGCKGAQ